MRGTRGEQLSFGQGRAVVKASPETWQTGICDGVGVGETNTRAEGTKTSGRGSARGDYVVHKIQG
jgi:hypothetical protein